MEHRFVLRIFVKCMMCS